MAAGLSDAAKEAIDLGRIEKLTELVAHLECRVTRMEQTFRNLVRAQCQFCADGDKVFDESGVLHDICEGTMIPCGAHQLRNAMKDAGFTFRVALDG